MLGFSATVGKGFVGQFVKDCGNGREESKKVMYVHTLGNNDNENSIDVVITDKY